ncbi:MAG: CvpA family protein [Endozoicomonadaceae bacterium]|nr:CvpA family protein [Endozoicomonadaceae bacterium]
MSLIDCCIFGFIGLFGLSGAFKGSKSEIFSILIWCAIIFISVHFQSILQDYIAHYGLEHELGNYLVSALLLAVILISVSALLKLLLTPLLVNIFPHILSRVVGLILGVVHGSLIFLYWIGIFFYTPFYFHPVRLTSDILPYVEQAVIWINHHKIPNILTYFN